MKLSFLITVKTPLIQYLWFVDQPHNYVVADQDLKDVMFMVAGLLKNP